MKTEEVRETKHVNLRQILKRVKLKFISGFICVLRARKQQQTLRFLPAALLQMSVISRLGEGCNSLRILLQASC